MARPASPRMRCSCSGPAYRDAGSIDPADQICRASGCSTRSPARSSSRATVTLAPGAQAARDVLRAVRAGSSRGVERCRPREDRCRRERASADFSAGAVTSGAAGAEPAAGRAAGRRASARRERDRGALSRAHARGARRRPARCPSSRPMAAHNRHVVLRDKERVVARRHGTILRTGQGMLLDETTLCATCWMHGVFAAQLTIGNTSFHKLFSVSRDPYNIMRSSGLRILIEAGGAWRLLAVPSAFEIGLSDCRWIYRLRRAHHHRARGRLGRRSGAAVAHHGRGRALPVSGVRPPRPRRARARPRGPDRDRRCGQAVRLPSRPGLVVGPALSGRGLPSGDQHAGRDRGDRRRRAAVRRRPVAGRRLRRDADASDGRAVLRRGGLADRSGSGGTPRGEVRARRRRSGDAGAGRALLGARHARSADHRPRPRGRGARHPVPVARAQCDGAPDRAARPGAVHRRRLGHARRLPGSGRIPAGARARRAGQGDPADRLRPAAANRGATGRSGSCSSPMPRSATATATAT